MLLALCATVALAQRNNNRNRGNNRNNNNRNNGRVRNQNPVIGNGFRATAANARDREGREVYPGCNGTVCLPEPRFCASRKNKREF